MFKLGYCACLLGEHNGRVHIRNSHRNREISPACKGLAVNNDKIIKHTGEGKGSDQPLHLSCLNNLYGHHITYMGLSNHQKESYLTTNALADLT